MSTISPLALPVAVESAPPGREGTGGPNVEKTITRTAAAAVPEPATRAHDVEAVPAPGLRLALPVTVPAARAKGSKWLVGRLIFQLIAPLVVAGVISYVACHHGESDGYGPSGEMAGDRVCELEGRRPTPDASMGRVAEFVHVFSICYYAVIAPINLLMHVAHHWRHRRRIPHICLCLLIASLGVVLCLVGWLFAFWLFGVGVVFVAGSHAVSITLEHWRSMTRMLR
jgi:hypothetical protein